MPVGGNSVVLSGNFSGEKEHLKFADQIGWRGGERWHKASC
jgi:hypothetical protein